VQNPIESTINRAINYYNKYRVPEVKADLIELDENSLKVSFEGSYCLTCGFHDYFDDFKIILEDLGLNTEIMDMDEKAPVTVKFKILK